MPIKNYASPQSKAVTDLRLELGLTQAEAARVVLTSPVNWQRWEKQGGMTAGLWELFERIGPSFKVDAGAAATRPGRHQTKAPYTRAGQEPDHE